MQLHIKAVDSQKYAEESLTLETSCSIWSIELNINLNKLNINLVSFTVIYTTFVPFSFHLYFFYSSCLALLEEGEEWLKRVCVINHTLTKWLTLWLWCLYLLLEFFFFFKLHQMLRKTRPQKTQIEGSGFVKGD